MDNILKLLLGVLSIAGLIAMLAPTNMPVASPVQAVASATPDIIAPTSENGEPLPSEEEMVENEAEDDPFSTGEPTIDGNPIGQPGQQNNINGESQAQQPPFPAFDPATYAVPEATNYAPPPVYNVPLGGPEGFTTIPSQ